MRTPDSHPARLKLLPGLLACLSFCNVASAAVPAQEYDALIAAARTGMAAQAAEKLQEWHRAEPDNPRTLYDLVTVLGMAGQHESALQYYSRIIHAEAPAYAIKALAHSARIAGKAVDAEAAYRQVLAKTPDDAEAHAGLAYALMDQGRLQPALAHLNAQLPRAAEFTRRDAPLLVARAELHEQRAEWLLAAAAYQDVLRIEPDFRYAVRGRAFALNRAGAFHLAGRVADSRPDIFTTDERRMLAQDAAARTVAFAQAGESDDAARYVAADRALDRIDEVAGLYGEDTRTRLDRMVALRGRMRMDEAVRIFESLRAEQADIPPYAMAAAADAYLYLEQPEIARDLYRAALDAAAASNATEQADWRFSLMYAYSEAGQHDAALALAGKLVDDTPAFMNKGTAAVEAPNQEYARAALTAAQMHLYAGQLHEAEQRLAELRAAAPFNSGVRGAWAALQTARERPRAALDEFTLLQTDDPESLEASVGRAEILLALNRLDEAKSALAPLLTNYPDNKAVQRLRRDMDSRDAFHLSVDALLGQGASVAGAESVFGATLYSPPLTQSLGSEYRVFSRLSRAEGDTAEASVSRTRVGAGIAYRMGDVEAEAEASHASGAADRSGVAGSVTWSISDAWHAHAALDTNVNDLAAAAFQNGVTGRSLRTGLTWVADESRRIGGEVMRIRFSDDNTRHAARLQWTERWLSRPTFGFETSVALSASSNSLDGARYFNPEHDREFSVSAVGEWLSWRRYERAFRQRLVLTAGHYAQKGFSGGAVGDARYEHEWRFDPRLSVRYGLGHAFHPYDGEREHRNYAFLHLYWRIK